MDNYATRVDASTRPGDMGSAQKALELVYELRSSAMNEIANRMSTALGDAGAEKATAAIASQMQKLLASDVIYESVTRPEIDGVLADNGIEGDDVPKSIFLPEGTRWLEESDGQRRARRRSAAPARRGTPGVHGLGLIGVSVIGTELVDGGDDGSAAEETPEVEVQVQNQGESTENGITVSVTVDGGNTLQGDIAASKPAKPKPRRSR